MAFTYDKIKCTMSVGATLRALRKERDLTQEALAEMLGVTPSHISYVERDKAKPSWGLLVKWANAVGANILTLLRDAGLIAPDTIELEQEVAAAISEYPELKEVFDSIQKYPDLQRELVSFVRWKVMEREAEAKLAEGAMEYDVGPSSPSD